MRHPPKLLRATRRSCWWLQREPALLGRSKMAMLLLGSETTQVRCAGYVYFEEEPGRRSAAHLLTRDEARRIAVVAAASRAGLRKGAVCPRGYV